MREAVPCIIAAQPRPLRMQHAALALATAMTLGSTTASATVVAASDLADLSLEQLGQVVVTSVARRPQRVVTAAASVYVITRDDIRRAGVTSLPEALRLAPNLQVARADTNQYAITARGSNAVLANKLLVMIDGRTIYTPLFSGVFWEVQDVLLHDVERIEVISGPGATLWGANAVNGVINVITRSSQATTGALAEAFAATDERGVAARYGANFPDGGFRIYAKGQRRDRSQREDGTAIADESDFAQVGFRSDFAYRGQGLTLQGDAYRGSSEMGLGERTLRGANLLGRMTRAVGEGGSLTVQGYFDHAYRRQPNFGETLDTYDLTLQHTLADFGRHSLLWGAGYRLSRDRVTNTAALAFIPANKTMHWSHVFAQDEIRLTDAVTATVGAKIERNPYTGGELLPNVRLAWQPAADRLLWGAWSRAVRAPSRVDRELFAPGAPPYTLAGGPGFQSEIANVAELGYRAQLGNTFAWSITAFNQEFDRLRSVEPHVGGLRIENLIEGRTRGVEAWAEYRPLDRWRIAAGVVEQRHSYHRKPGGLDPLGAARVGNDPDRWWTLRSSLDVAPGIEFDLMLRRIGALPTPAVPAYTALDARVGWRLWPDVELSFVVRNALDDRHVEWGAPGDRAEFERSFMVKLLWRQ